VHNCKTGPGFSPELVPRNGLCGPHHGRRPVRAGEKIGGAFGHLGLLERGDIFGGVRPFCLGEPPVTVDRGNGDLSIMIEGVNSRMSANSLFVRFRA
jgi:hypothetical protein